MGRVSGRVCLVTGAAQGIGRAIGEALLNEDADVCFADLKAAKAASVAEANAARAEAVGSDVMSSGVDVRDRNAVRGMSDAVVDRFGRLDAKFNNADVNKPMNFVDVTDENWNFIMGVNGLGCLIGMQEAARQMIAQGPGQDGGRGDYMTGQIVMIDGGMTLV